MVFTGSFSRRTMAAVATTATRDAGTRLKKRGQTIWMARAMQPTARAHRLTVSKQEINSSIFSTVSMGAFWKVTPKKSFSCPTTMVTAMPEVKPVVMV